MPSFAETVSEAIRDFAERGFDSETRLSDWLTRLRAAAEDDLTPEREVEEQLRRMFGQIYQRLIERGEVMRLNPGVSRYTIERIKPRLRLELDRRILGAADLIKLNRAAAIETTLSRFAGWATSVPPGGTGGLDVRQAARDVRRDLTSLAYRDRRVAIDQGHKFAANLSQVVAKDGGAIAAQWHQHYTRNPRHTHKLRDGKIYLLRDSWAKEKGLVKPGSAGYLDDISQPGEEVYCRCTATYLYSLRALLPDMLTVKGREELERVRQEIAA